MISYFRSGPEKRRRFRSDTRYATHTSDYGPRKMIFLRMPGAVVRYLHPTHLLPRHTSFIMTVIIDYAPTSNPLRPPLLPPASSSPRSTAPSTLSFFVVAAVLVVVVVIILVLILVVSFFYSSFSHFFMLPLRASRGNREQRIIATRGYTK